MASKLVTDREKSARAVVAAADTHARQAASAVDKKLSKYLKTGETMPDLALLARLVGRSIGSTSEALVKADRAHEAELGDDTAPREARDQAASQVRAVLVDLRAAIDVTYGTPGLTRLGLNTAAPIDPSVLAAQGHTVLDALTDDSVKLPKRRREGMKLDRQAFARELQSSLPALDKALSQVAKEAREAEGTLSAKQKAMADYDAAFSLGATWLSATFSLAAMDTEAAKVRPSTRRAGQTADSEPSNQAADATQGDAAATPGE